MTKKVIKLIAIITILVGVIFALSGCDEKSNDKNNNTTINTDNVEGLEVYTDERRKDFTRYSGALDVKLSYPYEWKETTQNEKQPVFMSADDTGAMVNITTYLTDVTIDQLLESSVKQIKETMDIEGDVSSKLINLNGRRAGRVDYVLKNKEQKFVEATEDEIKAEDVDVVYQFSQVVFIDDKTTYILSVAVPIENYDAVKDNLESIIRSFSK